MMAGRKPCSSALAIRAIFSDDAIDHYFVLAGANLSASELIQYRRLVGGGPSLKTWPRCASHRLHNTSILLLKKLLSGSVLVLFSESGSQKLGQPVPESNLLFELKSSLSQHTHSYTPSLLRSWYFPLNAGSVPFLLVILKCSGVSIRAHSSSLFITFLLTSDSFSANYHMTNRF